MTLFQLAPAAYRLLPHHLRPGLLIVALTNLLLALCEAAAVAAVVPFFMILTGQSLAEQSWGRLYAQLLDMVFPSIDPRVQAALLFGAFIAGKNALAYGCSHVSASYMAKVQASMTATLFSKYLNQPYLYHVQHGSPALVNKLNNTVNNFRGAILKPVIDIFTESLVCLLIMALIVTMNPGGALLAIAVVGGVAAAFYQYSKRKLVNLGREQMTVSESSTRMAVQALGGIKDVKLASGEAYFESAYTGLSSQQAAVEAKQAILSGAPRLIIETATAALMVTLVIAMAITGGLEGIATSLAFLGAASFRLMPSVNRLTMCFGLVRYGQWSLDLLTTDLQLVTRKVAASTDEAGSLGYIELRNIGFAYPGREWTIMDLTLRIPQGQCIGICGPSGSGKSTLVSLVAGLIQPQEGDIRMDGAIVDTASTSWRTQVGYVPQSLFMLDDSIRANIAFGVPTQEVDAGRLRSAISRASLDGVISSQPQGLDTVIGDRGSKLSGGQIQRLGIARALYRQPSLLILDESTSALDVDTEAAILDSVRQLKGSCTIVMIAHQVSTLANCDVVYKMIGGQLLPVPPVLRSVDATAEA